MKFFCLETGATIIRNHWTSLPVPAEVINYMNSLARQFSLKDINSIVEIDGEDLMI